MREGVSFSLGLCHIAVYRFVFQCCSLLGLCFCLSLACFVLSMEWRGDDVLTVMISIKGMR